MCPNDLNTYRGIVLSGERSEFHGDAREGDNIPNASFARALIVLYSQETHGHS